MILGVPPFQETSKCDAKLVRNWCEIGASDDVVWILLFIFLYDMWCCDVWICMAWYGLKWIDLLCLRRRNTSSCTSPACLHHKNQTKAKNKKHWKMVRQPVSPLYTTCKRKWEAALLSSEHPETNFSKAKPQRNQLVFDVPMVLRISTCEVESNYQKMLNNAQLNGHFGTKAPRRKERKRERERNQILGHLSQMVNRSVATMVAFL